MHTGSIGGSIPRYGLTEPSFHLFGPDKFLPSEDDSIDLIPRYATIFIVEARFSDIQPLSMVSNEVKYVLHAQRLFSSERYLFICPFSETFE